MTDQELAPMDIVNHSEKVSGTQEEASTQVPTQEKVPAQEEVPTQVSNVGDDNDEIMRLLSERLALGRQRYGHGVRVDEDPTQYGVGSNDWELMALEELLDGLIYTTAAIIRHMRNKQK